MFKHIPNILTSIRIVLVPFVFLFAINDNYIVAISILALSAVTDVLDGYIARKYNLVTNFGTVLDPLADKLTQITTLIILVIKQLVPLWILIIVISKELIMIIGGALLYDKKTVIKSKWYGKAATVVFYIAMFISMINKQFLLGFDSCIIYIYYIALALTIFALIKYILEYLKIRKIKQEA